MLAFALSALAGAVDPPTLDELLEDADIEDRRRIERALFSVDASIEETLALEEKLARKLDLLAPIFPAKAIVFSIDVAILDHDSTGVKRAALAVFARLSIDFETFASITRSRPILIPAGERIRERRCSTLGVDTASIELSALAERSLRERARALGCPWRST